MVCVKLRKLQFSFMEAKLTICCDRKLLIAFLPVDLTVFIFYDSL